MYANVTNVSIVYFDRNEWNEMYTVTDVYKCSMLANFIDDSLASLRCTRAWESCKAAVGNFQSILS